MSFCLPKFTADVLKGKFKSGEITPEKLSEMNSAERRQTLSFLGEENAKQVNALFESKLLLKNQQAGMITWAKQILKLKPDVLRDTLTKVQKMTEVLSEQDLQKYKEDLVNKKLGFGMTMEQAGKLVDMAKQIEKTKSELPPEMTTMDNREYLKQETSQQKAKRIEYGVKLALFKDYVEHLKPSQGAQTFKELITTPSKYFEEANSMSKSIVASYDNSFWGNQGITTLLNPLTTHLWVKNFIKSFGDIAKALKGEDPMIAVKAEAYSRPDAVNGTYQREGLDIGINTEEALPTLLPEKIPILGRLFKASNAAYNGAALRLRVDLADRFNSLARKQGLDLTDTTQAEAIGHLVNGETGRGYLGKAAPIAPKLNVLVFSVKLMKGAFDTVTLHILDPKVRSNPFAMKQATKTLLGMTATYLAISSISEALNPGSSEIDPRAPHFGQIKIGNSWVNITGPYRPIIRTLTTALPTYRDGKFGWWRKDQKGKWNYIPIYGSKAPAFGATTPLDLAESFFENKASPLTGTILSHMRGRDFTGKPPTPKGDITGLITPIDIKSYLADQQNPKVDNAVLNTTLNFFGFNPTTY